MFSNSKTYSLVPITQCDVAVAKTSDPLLVQVTLTHTCANDLLDEPVELVYSVDLGDVVVSKIKTRIGTRSVEAKVQEKKKAEEEYNDGIASGASAIMFKKKGKSYEMSLGNLAPLSECAVEITYATLLYAESDSRSKLFLSESLLCEKKNTLSVGLLSVYVEDEKVAGSIEIQKKDTTIEFDAPEFSTTLSLEKYVDGTCVACLSYVPMTQAAGDAKEPQEIVFLVDCSGSMSRCMRETREALLFFVQSLPVNCKFNVVRFGTKYVCLFEKSMPYNEESLTLAKQFIKDLQANMSGTNILAPLQHVLSDTPKSVVVLSDGSVENTKDVIEWVRSKNESNTVYALGMGDGVDHELIDGLAREGRSLQAVYIDEHNVRRQVLRMLNFVTEPYLCDISVEWKGVDTIACIPVCVTRGESFHIYGRVKDDKVQSLKAILRTTMMLRHTKIQRASLTVSSNQLKEGTLLNVMCASKEVDLLEEKECIRVSEKYNVLSNYTSFVAVIQQEDGGVTTQKPMRTGSSRGMLDESVCESVCESACTSLSYRNESLSSSNESGASSLGAYGTSKKKKSVVRLADLIALQGADGRWKIGELAALLGLDIVERGAEWPTALAIAYMQLNFASEKQDWSMIVAKTNVPSALIEEAKAFLKS